MSWFLFYVISQCICRRCNLAYMVPLGDIHIVCNTTNVDYAIGLRQHDVCYFEDHRSISTPHVALFRWNSYYIANIWYFILKHAADLSLQISIPFTILSIRLALDFDVVITKIPLAEECVNMPSGFLNTVGSYWQSDLCWNTGIMTLSRLSTSDSLLIW